MRKMLWPLLALKMLGEAAGRQPLEGRKDKEMDFPLSLQEGRQL